ncbi:MAG: radical SAM protein, partial [Spirochaetota bacterium]|nr:radical SAM protein [Spirochaetota bacterium]
MHNAEQFINNTTSLCKICKNAINANIIANSKNEVWMIKTCSEHGDQDVRLSTNADWYTKTRLIEPLKTVPTDIKKSINYGCPFDCGPCENHEQKIRLPIVTITSSCNLNCPICYVHNKNENPYNMSIEEFKSILMHLTKNKENKLDIINLTGGEPTLHPKILDFLKLSRDTGVHRVSICSNGISLAENEPMIKQIGELNGRIALSFDSFNPQTYLRISGVDTFKVKIKCLELLKKYNIDTTLITVMNKEINDNEIGEIIKFALSMSNLRHLEIHTITYTGQGGVNINRASRISIYEVLEKIEQTTNGLLNTDDFIPAPSAHSLCYQIAYLLIDPDDGRAIPFTRFMDKQILYECLEDHLYLEPSPTL